MQTSEKQEHVFVLLMLALAFLYRENPILVFPHALVFLFALLVYNFIQHRLILDAKHPQLVHGLSLAVNSLLITAVLHYSGGKDSSFWVLLLLPIFSSVIMHSKVTTWLTLAMTLTVLGAFYLDMALVPKAGDEYALGTKIVVLVVALVLTQRLAFVEREAKIVLEEERRVLGELQAKTEESNQLAARRTSMGQHAAQIADELNAPLAVIRGYSALLSEESSPGSKPAADLRQIQEAAEMCQGLVAHLMGLSGREDYSLTPTSIREVFDRARRLTLTLFRQKKVSLSGDLEADLPAVQMSPGHIVQVLLTLLNNALRVSGPGDMVKVSAFRTMGAVTVSVSDQGPGVPVEAARKLAGSSWTDDAADASGLAVIRRIIERHGGSIAIADAPEGGAICSFNLPLAH